MKKNSKYMTRALKSRDPRFKNVLGKLGYETVDMKAGEKKKSNIGVDANKAIENFHQQRQLQQPVVEPVVEQAQDDLSSLRAKYKDVFGKQPYYGWNEDKLRQMIAEGK